MKKIETALIVSALEREFNSIRESLISKESFVEYLKLDSIKVDYYFDTSREKCFTVKIYKEVDRCYFAILIDEYVKDKLNVIINTLNINSEFQNSEKTLNYKYETTNDYFSAIPDIITEVFNIYINNNKK